MKRLPAVAGLFYPEDADQLKTDVLSYLNAENKIPTERPKAMILPHAGYIYSARLASHGYQLIKAHAETIKHVVLIGPAHHSPFYGIAISTASAFSTPLGDIPVNEILAKKFVSAGLAKYLDEPHLREHCLEVHLPFLQMTLSDFTIVPIVVGLSNASEVSRLLDAAWGNEETLIIVSSDLSHYHPYDEAQIIDARTAKAIENFDSTAIHAKQACGALPICGLLKSAKEHALKLTHTALCNSGDTAGKKDAVVGYGTFIFS